MKVEYNPELVDLSDVPARKDQRHSYWRQRFNELPEGKAAMLKYNNRQWAHQVRHTVSSAARHYGVEVQTRIIRGDMAIYGTDAWLLYFWKDSE